MNDENRYSCPPRRPDDVLDPLRSPPACRMQRSFVLLMDTKIRCIPLRWTGSSSLLVSFLLTWRMLGRFGLQWLLRLTAWLTRLTACLSRLTA